MNGEVSVNRQEMSVAERLFMELGEGILDRMRILFADLRSLVPFTDEINPTDADNAFKQAWDPAMDNLAIQMDDLQDGLGKIGDSFAGQVKVWNLADDTAAQEMDQIVPSVSPGTTPPVRGTH
jgi:hypothetical protein